MELHYDCISQCEGEWVLLFYGKAAKEIEEYVFWHNYQSVPAEVWLYWEALG